VDSACSITLSTHRTDFIKSQTAHESSAIDGVGVVSKSSGTMRIKIHLQSCDIISRVILTLFTPTPIARSSHGISRLSGFSGLQKYCGCEFSFPSATDIGMLMIVPTEMGVLRPYGNALYTLPLLETPNLDIAPNVGGYDGVARTSPTDATIRHNRLARIHMHGLQGQHDNGVEFVPHLGHCVRNVSCDSCLLHNTQFAVRNMSPSPKHVSQCFTCRATCERACERTLALWFPLLHPRHRPPLALHVGQVHENAR
jgi:hypothetical protein